MSNRVLWQIVRSDGRVEGPWQTTNLRTSDGINYQANLMGNRFNGSGATDACIHIGLTENTDAPASGNTNLVGESLMSNGLSRTTGTYSHTADASSYTLSADFFYTGASTVTIAKECLASGITNVDTSLDTHFAITAISPVAVLNSNDTLSVAHGIFI